MLFKVFNRRCSRECFNVRAWQQKGSWSCSLQWSSFNLWLIPDTQNMSFFNAVITFCCPVTPFPSLFLSAHLPAKNFSGSNNRPVSLWEYRNVGGRPPGCDRGGSGNPIQSKQTIKKKKKQTQKKNPRQTNPLDWTTTAGAAGGKINSGSRKLVWKSVFSCACFSASSGLGVHTPLPTQRCFYGFLLFVKGKESQLSPTHSWLFYTIMLLKNSTCTV